MTKAEIISGLKDLVRDKESFIREDEDIFVHDKSVLEASIGELCDAPRNDYPQDTEPNEYRYISPAWLDKIAEGLTAGAAKHPGETWRQIPTDEHLARAMRHINLYRKGDRNEPHIINASMRLMMAYRTADTLGLKHEEGDTEP